MNAARFRYGWFDDVAKCAYREQAHGLLPHPTSLRTRLGHLHQTLHAHATLRLVSKIIIMSSRSGASELYANGGAMRRIDSNSIRARPVYEVVSCSSRVCLAANWQYNLTSDADWAPSGVGCTPFVLTSQIQTINKARHSTYVWTTTVWNAVDALYRVQCFVPLGSNNILPHANTKPHRLRLTRLYLR